MYWFKLLNLLTIVINIDPVAFSIGSFALHWYGMMYFIGITIGLVAAWPYARARGFTSEQLEKVVYWSIPAGLIGGRLYYVLQQPLDQFVREPWRIIAVWDGGMAFYGGVFAVLIVLFVTSRREKISFLKLLDFAALFAVVGQFFGRIGNIINGDVIGYTTDLPWGFVYAHPNSFPPRHDIAYHPAAVYEALINVVLFGIIWWLRNRLKPGVLFFIYIVSYSLSQIIVFIWRDNVAVFWGLKQAQLTAMAVVIVAVVIFIIYYRRRQHTAEKV